MLCLAQDPEHETRSLPHFDQLDVSGAFEVYLQPGQVNSVELEAQGVELEAIRTEVEGKILYLDLETSASDRGPIRPKRPIIHLTYQELTRIDWEGTGGLHTVQPLLGKKLALEIRGTGTITMRLQVTNLSVSMAGSGKVELTGIAHTQQITLNGLGSFDGRHLRGKTAYVQHSGAGTVWINAQKQLDVFANGIGSIWYMGQPALVNLSSEPMNYVKPMEE